MCLCMPPLAFYVKGVSNRFAVGGVVLRRILLVKEKRLSHEDSNFRNW